MREITLQELCTLLGVEKDNALIADVWQKLQKAGCKIFESKEAFEKHNPVKKAFKDFTTRNENNLTGTV